MAAHQHRTVSLSQLFPDEIPSSIRKKQIGKLTREDKKTIEGILFIKELVQASYKRQSKIIQDTIRLKRKKGYCGGFIYCLAYTGPDKYMCEACKRQKANPRYHKKLSSYGEIRRVERAKEKLGKSR